MKPEAFPNSPKYLWDIFYNFTQTPRPSKKEEKIRAYLVKEAESKKLDYKIDSAGNLLIFVPGKNGRENDDALLIQNHIDMVTDALQGMKFNFDEDPLSLNIEGEWLKAQGTTLGADNGIGCAAALATIYDDTLVHPPLELLFTVDEETGLNGALGLEVENITAKKMLNLDTEEWGSLYIGCAGGIDYEMTKKLERIDSNLSHCYKLNIDGLIGGHSGVDIHEQRGNAIKILMDCLDAIRVDANLEIEEIRGGKAHNIIPRDAFVIFRSNLDAEKIQELIKPVVAKWKSFLPENDKTFEIKLTSEESSDQVLSSEISNDFIDLIQLFPHGAHSYDLATREIVSTSNNLARLLIVRDNFYLQTSLRFFDREEIKLLESKLRILSKSYEMELTSHSEYPSWKPVANNSVLDLVKSCYKELYGKEPIVTAIHAGLECGILRDKIGPIDVISFGPTIMGAHSPDERVHIPSVEKFWELFKLVLKKI